MKKYIPIVFIMIFLLASLLGTYLLLNKKGSKSRANSSQTLISSSEVSEHNSASSCYISLKGEVYDITSFISRHPGGRKIVEECGKNVDSFSTRHPGGNLMSKAIQKVLSPMKIGKLA